MLEYNADTPSMTIESSVLQAEWFQYVNNNARQQYSQANLMKEAMDTALKKIAN